MNNLTCSNVHTCLTAVIIQIDESLFNHKAKYNRGRSASKEQFLVWPTHHTNQPLRTCRL
jgi:hypothetical protein